MPLKIKKNKYDFNFKRLIIMIVQAYNVKFLLNINLVVTEKKDDKTIHAFVNKLKK